MLSELHIRDLVLIEGAEVGFGPSLNVVSGETGAGKTLLVTSLELLLGLTPRGGLARLVRKGAEEARVEGRFELSDPELRRRFAARVAELLPELELDADGLEGEGALIVGRRVTKDGRSRAHLDQRPIPVGALRQLAPLLLEIHGQNEHQKLLDPAEQLRLYDGFAGVGAVREAYRTARAAWLAARHEAARVRAEAQERRDRLDLLRFQQAELDEARLEEGEQARLTAERAVLRKAGELGRVLGRWCETLCEGEPAVRDSLNAAENELERWGELLPGLASVVEDLRAAAVHVEEAGGTLRTLLDGVVDDPARLEVVEERLDELERLCAKYRCDEAGLLARRAEALEELRRLEDEEESAGELDQREARAREALVAAAGKLSARRAAATKKLAKAVEAALAELGLAKARFEPGLVAVGEGEAPDEQRFGPQGVETAEFLLAANPGEEPRPLRLVASGGETARIMLALRSVLSADDRGRTLVFDEIDAGVGGRLGPQVGAHLRRLADHHQVLCVTHLPAIAAQAARHVKVEKTVEGGRTRTAIVVLEGDARVSEVADMIAGGAKHASARAEARRLLEST